MRGTSSNQPAETLDFADAVHEPNANCIRTPDVAAAASQSAAPEPPIADRTPAAAGPDGRPRESRASGIGGDQPAGTVAAAASPLGPRGLSGGCSHVYSVAAG